MSDDFTPHEHKDLLERIAALEHSVNINDRMLKGIADGLTNIDEEIDTMKDLIAVAADAMA